MLLPENLLCACNIHMKCAVQVQHTSMFPAMPVSDAFTEQGNIDPSEHTAGYDIVSA